MTSSSYTLMIIVAILGGLDIIVDAAFITNACIEKRPLVGYERGTSFSDADKLTNQIDRSMRAYAYTECTSDQGDLKSFSIVLADYDNENRTSMDKVGAITQEGTIEITCPGFRFPSVVITKAVIYGDDQQIYGIRFLTLNGPADLGNQPVLDTAPELETFNLTSQFIGFYGSYDSETITSLGFLTHDPACEKIDIIEPVVVVEEVVEVIEEVIEEEIIIDDSEDGGSSMGLIIILVLAIPTVIGALVFLVIFCRRRKRKMSVGITDENSKGGSEIIDQVENIGIEDYNPGEENEHKVRGSTEVVHLQKDGVQETGEGHDALDYEDAPQIRIGINQDRGKRKSGRESAQTDLLEH